MKRARKMNFIQKVWILIRPFHKNILAISIMTAVFELVRMGAPYLFGKILDLLVETKGLITVETAITVVLGLAGVRVASLFIDFLTDIVVARTSVEADRYISTTAFNKLMELSLDYHEKTNTGAKISIVQKGTDKLIELLDNFSWEFQPVVMQLVFSAILILLTSWRLGLIFSLSLIPFLLITYKIYDSTKKLRFQRYDAYELSSGELSDTVINISVVKAYAQEKRENQAFGSIRTFIKSTTLKEIYRHFTSGFARNLLIELFGAVLLVVGLIEIKHGALTVGSLFFLINVTERAYSNIFRLGRIYERAADASEPVNRLTNLLNQKPSVENKEGAKVMDIEGGITFDHVSFGYSKKEVLQDVSFRIPAGSFTAFVGRSGGGKSTIAKLISRYYDPTEGKILIDHNLDLRDLDLDSFRKQTSVVFQDSPVPNRKVWEVISYSVGKKSFASVKNDCIRAAKLAYAHEFIMELKDGYHTLIGERGVKLSGGQRQRLAIARALFAQPKILIMDEPTSHLDTLSEGLIQKALEDISQERAMTKIIIAHRLSTVQRADQILVMDKGRLVEQGTHSQLLSKGGVYAAIVKQSELKA
jgi:ABC-type multidrug transport system fused ATPase/permease subunit